MPAGRLGARPPVTPRPGPDSLPGPASDGRIDTITPPLLAAQDLTATFPGPDDGPPVQVLRGVSLRVDPGEMVSIVGPSGSGKSTLLYCLSGLSPVASGTVQLLGQSLTTLRRSQLAALRRGRVGFVFQSYNLIPSLSARENVALPARLARRRLSEDDIDRALAQVGLANRGAHRPSALSGGQQQRVAVAGGAFAGAWAVGSWTLSASSLGLPAIGVTAAGGLLVVLAATVLPAMLRLRSDPVRVLTAE